MAETSLDTTGRKVPGYSTSPANSDKVKGEMFKFGPVTYLPFGLVTRVEFDLGEWFIFGIGGRFPEQRAAKERKWRISSDYINSDGKAEQ